MASQITSPTSVCSTIYSGTDQRKHQSSASLAFVRGIHRWLVNSPHKGPVTRKMFPFGDVIMASKWNSHWKARCYSDYSINKQQISYIFVNIDYSTAGILHGVTYQHQWCSLLMLENIVLSSQYLHVICRWSVGNSPSSSWNVHWHMQLKGFGNKSYIPGVYSIIKIRDPFTNVFQL